MTQTVELPLWLLILILLFAAVTAATHLLFPSVRWFFRRRAERLVAQLNARLRHPIQPFKLLRRQDMIQRVIYDPEVVRAAGAYAHAEGLREDVGFEKARDYAREIVPAFSASAYFGFATRVARLVATWLFDVRLIEVDKAALAATDQNATVVYVMNHRSNIDYFLVTYLVAPHTALSYAVGEWAHVWPMSSLIRAMGAYFIRRRSRTALYRKVLSIYVQKATAAGVTQAVFPEGGLSRDGHVGPSKLGILSYIVEGSRDADAREVVFVPVSLNYDRVVEDKVLLAAGRTGTRRFRASIPESLRFAVRYLRRRLTGEAGRFGVAAVAFGRPVPLSEIGPASDEGVVAALAERLSSEIRAATPVTTVPLVMAALWLCGGSASIGDLAGAMARIRSGFGNDHLDVAIDGGDSEGLEQHLDIQCRRGILTRDGEKVAIAAPDLAVFYANSIRPHLSADAQATIPLSFEKAKTRTT